MDADLARVFLSPPLTTRPGLAEPIPNSEPHVSTSC
jgi:hypothetical protein